MREHFGEQLQAGQAAAWREAHGRLYEYYKGRAPELPDTLEAMAPLYAAVAHGCAAGRHQEALDEVYWRRIQRGNEFYATKKLGAFGADLAALAGFFDPPWRRPVAGLTEADKAFVLNEAGFDLRALGRLAEATEPMQAGLEAAIAQEDWKNAAIRAGNLSELALTAGDLPAAIRYAEQSVELADRSGDAFQRMVKSHDPGRRAAPGRPDGRGRGPLPGGGGDAGGAAAGVPAPLLAAGLPVLRPAAGAGAGGGGAAPGRADVGVGQAGRLACSTSPSTTSPWAGRT